MTDRSKSTAATALDDARTRSQALKRVATRLDKRQRVARTTGAIALAGGAATAAMAAGAVIAGPFGWIGAAVAGVAGAVSLWTASRARERASRAATLMKRFEHSDAGKLIELDALIKKLDAQRGVIASAYARHEATLVAETGRSGDRKSALLARLRSRQLAEVRQIDALRQQAVALQQRLAARSVADEEDSVWLSEAAVLSTVNYDNELQRNAFRASDMRESVTSLSDQADALEELTAEFELAD